MQRARIRYCSEKNAKFCGEGWYTSIAETISEITDYLEDTDSAFVQMQPGDATNYEFTIYRTTIDGLIFYHELLHQVFVMNRHGEVLFHDPRMNTHTLCLFETLGRCLIGNLTQHIVKEEPRFGDYSFELGRAIPRKARDRFVGTEEDVKITDH